MTSRSAIVTSSLVIAGVTAAIVFRNHAVQPKPMEVATTNEDLRADDRAMTEWLRREAAAAVCPTARPIPTYAPTPASAYCTEKRYYVRACETGQNAPYTRMWTTAPGFAGQICSAHTYAWAGEDGFVYPIVDQGPVSNKYPRPPSTAPGPLAAWISCWINKNPPAGGYEGCLANPAGGTLVYQPITLAQVPNPPRDSWAIQYGCCQTPSPSPTTTPVPITPGAPTATPHVICIPVTVTPKVAAMAPDPNRIRELIALDHSLTLPPPAKLPLPNEIELYECLNSMLQWEPCPNPVSHRIIRAKVAALDDPNHPGVLHADTWKRQRLGTDGCFTEVTFRGDIDYLYVYCDGKTGGSGMDEFASGRGPTPQASSSGFVRAENPTFANRLDGPDFILSTGGRMPHRYFQERPCAADYRYLCKELVSVESWRGGTFIVSTGGIVARRAD